MWWAACNIRTTWWHAQTGRLILGRDLIRLNSHGNRLVGHRLEQRVLIIGGHVLVVIDGHNMTPHFIVLARAFFRLGACAATA